MTCREFVARYSDFRDGLITAPREARRYARHLASCAACQRYDAALQRGIGSLQAKGPEPDTAFRTRLERRLASERVKAGRPSLPARPAFAAALLLAIALGLIAWETTQQHRTKVVTAPTLPPVPFPKPVAQAGVPFVSFQDPRTSVVSGNPYPYGTVYVEPAFVEPVSASSSTR